MRITEGRIGELRVAVGGRRPGRRGRRGRGQREGDPVSTGWLRPGPQAST